MSSSAPVQGQRLLLGIVALVLGAVVLYQARAVLVPVVLAAFLAVLLVPAMRWLSRFLPRWLVLVVLFTGVAGLVASGSALILVNVDAIAAKAPFYTARFQQLFGDLREWLAGIGIDLHWRSLSSGEGMSAAFQFLASSLESAASAAGQIVLVLFLLVFLLLEAHQLPRKLGEAFSLERRDQLLSTLGRVTDRVQQYVTTKTLVNASIGLLVGLVVLALDVDFPFLWGLLAFLLNFIPQVGSVIATVPPVLIALLQHGTLTRPLIVLSCLIGLHTVIGNIIEPRLLGRSLNLSPLVVLLSLLFWGWLWGLAGVVLAVPLTVTAQIACQQSESLRPVAVLLGRGRDT